MRVAGLLILFAVCLIAERSQATPPTAEKRALTIGVIVPLSGTMASIGQSLQAAIRYAAQREQPVPTLRVEDDQFQPKMTVSAMRRLLSQGERPDAFIILGSPTCLAVVDELERLKIPTICLSIYERVSQGKKYVFRLFPHAEQLATALHHEALRRNYHRVSVMSSQTDGLLSISSKFLAQFPKDRLRITQEIAPSDSDLAPYVTRILASKSDAVLVMLLPHQFSPFVAKLLHAGFDGGIFNAVSLANSSVMHEVRQIAPDAWYAFFSHENATELTARIEQETKIELDAEGLLGHEALRLLALASKKGPDLALALQSITTLPSILGDIHRHQQDFNVPVTVNTLR